LDPTRFDRLTRGLAKQTTRRTALGATLAGLGLGLTSKVSAQEATPAPGAEGEIPVFMFVQTFASGRGELNPGAGTPTVHGPTPPGGAASFLLTLEGHTGQTIYFSDRPDRIVGASPTVDFLDGIGFSPINPPNAALVAEFERGRGVVVLELIEPVYTPEMSTLVYGAEVLEGYEGENLAPVLADQVAARLPARIGPATLFIDDCPAFTSCYHDDDQNDYAIREYVGPIPGGPYPLCYYPEGVSCRPCGDYDVSSLSQLCRDYYKRDLLYAWY
jgi:hypothetical protein